MTLRQREELMGELLSKRQLLIGGGSLGLTVLASKSSRSQDSPVLELDFAAGEIGATHSRYVLAARRSVIDGNVFIRESFSAALQRLVELGLISKSEARALLSMIDAFLRGKTLDDISRNMEKLYKNLLGSLNKVASAIAEIIRDSVRVARELLGSEVIQWVIEAIAHDVRGAIDGAANGASLGSIVPRFGKVTGAIIGALLGASSASIIGQYNRQ